MICIACNRADNQNGGYDSEQYSACSQAEKESKEPEETLLFLSESGDIYTAYRKDGDQDVMRDIHVQWNKDGCILKYYNTVLGENEQTEVHSGEISEITIKAIPVFNNYKVYLCHEGDSIPEEWNEVITEKERKEQWQANYGTYEDYLDARNTEEEEKLIQDAFDEAGLSLTAVYWYHEFTDATWDNAIPFTIKRAVAAIESNDMICLTLIDTDDNLLQIYGVSDDLIELALYNGVWCYRYHGVSRCQGDG